MEEGVTKFINEKKLKFDEFKISQSLQEGVPHRTSYTVWYFEEER